MQNHIIRVHEKIEQTSFLKKKKNNNNKKLEEENEKPTGDALIKFLVLRQSNRREKKK